MEYRQNQASGNLREMYEVFNTAPSKNIPPSPVPKPPAGKPTLRDKVESEKNVETPKKIMGGKKMEEYG
jgi:hypothetical protein